MNFDNEFKKEIEAKAPLKVELKKIDNHIITNKPTNNNCWDAKNLASARIHTWPPDA